jgi:hypothetical protein
MIEYIPGDIFRASFKFGMGDKLREKWRRVKRIKLFSVNFNVHTPIQIVFLNNLKIVGPLSKMKPCTRGDSKIGKKNTRELCVQTFDNQVNAVVGAHMKE